MNSLDGAETDKNRKRRSGSLARDVAVDKVLRTGGFTQSMGQPNLQKLSFWGNVWRKQHKGNHKRALQICQCLAL